MEPFRYFSNFNLLSELTKRSLKMHGKLTVVFLALCWPLLHTTDGANILVVMPLPARSHFKSFQPLFEEIVERGYNLTMVSGHRLSKNIRANYTHIDISQHFHKLNIVFAEMAQQNRIENLMFCTSRVQEYGEFIIQLPKIQDLLKSNDNYDLIIGELFFLDIFLAFGYRFDAPVIGLSPQPLLPYYNWIMGNPSTPSYIPNLYLPMTEKMSFFERIFNTMFNSIAVAYYEMVSLPESQRQLEKFFYVGSGKPVPKMREIMLNVSVTFVNTHYSFGYPKPNLPNIIETAGLHITSYGPLPSNLQKFMNDAPHGVIYLSLGTLIEPQYLEHLGNLFIKLLEHLPQRILFKWNPELLSSTPKNFLVQEWLPQMAILNHPNCRAFITHGGLHSLLESLNSSVPMIGIPFFSDQKYNMRIVEYYTIGLKVEMKNIEKELLPAVNEILTNPTYQKNIKTRSKLFNERINSPIETAMYWVEHVIKFKNTSHLKSASLELAWYQYFLVDVVGTLILVSSLTIYVLYLTIKALLKSFKHLRGKITKRQNRSKKTK